MFLLARDHHLFGQNKFVCCPGEFAVRVSFPVFLKLPLLLLTMIHGQET